MIIRKAKIEDLGKILRLEKEYAKHCNSLLPPIMRFKLVKGLKKAFLRRIKRKSGLYLVAEENNKLCGFYEGYYEKVNWLGYDYNNKIRGYVCNTYIRPKFRGKGIFSMFHKEFLKFLKAQKVRYCMLDVDVDNKNSIKIYEHLGFKPIEYKMMKKI